MSASVLQFRVAHRDSCTWTTYFPTIMISTVHITTYFVTGIFAAACERANCFLSTNILYLKPIIAYNYIGTKTIQRLKLLFDFVSLP